MALTVKIRADASHFKKTIAGIEVQASGLTGVMAKLGGSIPVFGAALAGAAAGAVALGAGLAFIKDASTAASGMESLTMQFETLTGSAEKANALIKTFRDEAVKSPLSVKDYADAARGFMSYGMEAEKVLPTLKMLGDIAMGNSQRFGLLTYAMAQVSANATLNGEDLRQLVSQGFNPLAVISEKTGKSMGQLREEMSKHQITYGMVEDAMKQVTSEGGRFFGAIEKGAATTEGKIAKLGDAVLGLKVSFGEGFNVGLRSALDATNSFLPQLESAFGEIGKTLGKAISDAVQGDFQLFAKIGILIGEAVKAGFMDVAGNMVVEAMRGWMNFTASGLDASGQAAAGMGANALLGPQQSLGDRATGISDTLKPLLQDVITERDRKDPTMVYGNTKEQIIELRRMRVAVEEQLKGSKLTRQERKELLFSR